MQNVKHIIPSLLLVTLVAFLACSKDDETVAPEYQESDIIGTWNSAITWPGIIDINVTAEFNSAGNRHAFYATELDTTSGLTDTVYWHEGTWSVQDNNVQLDGSNCWAVDSSGVVTPFDCGEPLAFPINLTDKNTWLIPLGSIADMAESQGYTIPQEMTGVSIAMKKQ